MRLACYDERVTEKMAASIVRPGGTVAITDEVAHPYTWMREEHADVWLGFEREQVGRYFAATGLEDYRYEALGMQ